jgi:hypothetical protein
MAEGPYSFVLEALATGLENDGYSCRTIQGYLQGARHLTYCLEHQALPRSEVTLDGLRRFAAAHFASCDCPHLPRDNVGAIVAAVAHILPHLRAAGLAPAPQPGPYASELLDYGRFLAEIRGLTDETIAMRRSTLGRVLQHTMIKGRFDAARLTAVSLQAYINQAAKTQSPHGVARILVTIRSFLRFLQVRGLDTGRVAPRLMGPPTRAPGMSTKALSMAQLRAVVRAAGVRTPVILRNRAIILLVARAGLRRSEVVRLRLGDFDAR